MKPVTFRKDWDHVTPMVTTAYKAKTETELAPDVENLARAADALEPDVYLKKR